VIGFFFAGLVTVVTTFVEFSDAVFVVLVLVLVLVLEDEVAPEGVDVITWGGKCTRMREPIVLRFLCSLFLQTLGIVSPLRE
jgi:hypothetical protein